MADNDDKNKNGSKTTRVVLPYKLLSAETIKSLVARAGALPADTVVYVQVKTPPNVRKDKPLRRDFERGVQAELEAGVKGSIDAYNDKPLCVAQVGPTFRYKSTVKEETIRKVSVTKV